MGEGMALLDEAMLAVLSGELRPEWAGNVYCHLMAAFHELADVRRAAEWTESTGRWLAGLPAAVLFTGMCRVHRSQVPGPAAHGRLGPGGRRRLRHRHAIVLLAGAFPASSFVGYDLAADAIARARSEAAGLANARFEVRDAARPEVTEPFDVVFVFDAIHDQVAPAAVLERIWAALVPGGTFVMVEPGVSQQPGGQPRQPDGADAVWPSTRPRATRSTPCSWPPGRAPGRAQAGAAGPADLASTWTPTWRLSRPRMAEMPRRRRGEITRSRPRAV